MYIVLYSIRFDSIQFTIFNSNHAVWRKRESNPFYCFRVSFLQLLAVWLVGSRGEYFVDYNILPNAILKKRHSWACVVNRIWLQSLITKKNTNFKLERAPIGLIECLAGDGNSIFSTKYYWVEKIWATNCCKFSTISWGMYRWIDGWIIIDVTVAPSFWLFYTFIVVVVVFVAASKHK